jgi:hypothetical protein
MPNLSERKILFAGREAALRKPELRESVVAKELLMSRCPASPLAAPKAAAALDGFNGHRPDPPVPEEGDGRNTKIALRSFPSGRTAGQNAMKASRIKRVSAEEKTAKPIEITEIVEGAQCTAAYIAQLTGELATLANGARFANLAHLLARAQLEAELWSLQSK